MKNNPNGQDKNHKKHDLASGEPCDCIEDCGDNCGCREAAGVHLVANEAVDEPAVNEPLEEADEELLQGGELGILNKKIENLEFQLKEKNDEMLRRAADIDNYRKRLEKEADERLKYANKSVASDFISVLDNIELTLQYTEEGSQLQQGVELTIKLFKETLAKYGVKEIDASLGVKFDPTYHEGIMLGNDPEYPKDSVTLCVQKGYILHDRVIRPAKVRVNKI